MLYEAATGTALFADVGGVSVLPELHLVGAMVGLGAALSVRRGGTARNPQRFMPL